MSWTLTLSTAAKAKAGINANASIVVSNGVLTAWADQAEGHVVAMTRRDWVTDYSSLSTEVKAMLSDIVSSLIAKQIISYDMSGYSSKAEAQTMLDVHDDIVQRGIEFLRDFKSNTIKSAD